MNSPLLLDCTLRDGGYVNNWDFGLGSIKNIISRLDHADVDIIEIGFLDDTGGAYDENKSIFPDTKSIKNIFKDISKPKATTIAMTRYGTCSLDNISDQPKSCLDGIRVIFQKDEQDGAIEYIKRIKEKGYKIFINPVCVTNYTEEEVSALVDKINSVDPYAVSCVDTYGLMHSQEMLKYFDIYNNKLSKNIILGYHAHNNFQMAYANSITLMNKKLDRPLSIDGTLYGMGSRAGNACTELLAMYMNEYCGRNFNIYQILEAIDVNILKEIEKRRWGYDFEYFLAAMNDCHPTYVEYLLNKKTLSIKSINELLSNIPHGKKIPFNRKVMDDLYSEYQHRYCDDAQAVAALKKEFVGKKLLLLGPGKTLQNNSDDIKEFIKNQNPITVSINFIDDSLPIDYVFMGNSKRYSQFFHRLYKKNEKAKIICTSNITEAGKEIDFVINNSALLSDNAAITDNPMVMFLRLLKNMGITDVWLAGFDGYSNDNSTNYHSDYVKFLYCNDDVMLRNDAIKEALRDMSKIMKITSLTPTRYL